MVTSWSAGHDGGDVPAAASDMAAELGPATGRRIAAALVDVALLTGLFLILGLTVGNATLGGGFSVSLSAGWSGLYLALLLVYYFALEASIGQTVGKCLLGLRVVRRDGGRPSAWAIAGRTLLRLIDWLPALYLVGFITMLATGRGRRQRLGDLAARTAIARALPVRHRGLVLAPLALVVLAVAGLSVYRAATAGGAQTYRAHGVSFDYPAGWQQTSPMGDVWMGPVRQKLWSVALSIERAHGVGVAAYRLSAPFPKIPIGPVPPAGKRFFRHFMEQGRLALQTGPEEITLGGMRAYLVEGSGTDRAIPVEDTFVFAFNGTTEYVLVCEHQRQQGADVACGQVIRTFRVTRAA